MIFFTNFLALIIQAELADKDSSGSAVYSALLILVHVFFLLSICWNSWATVRSTVGTTFARRHLQVWLFRLIKSFEWQTTGLLS